MGNIVDQVEGPEQQPRDTPVRCPICGRDNQPGAHCPHVRWTFDQGDPLDFARFAMETSRYRHPKGLGARSISRAWWEEHGDWVFERVLERFAAVDGFVFGEPAELDLLTMDIWKAVEPPPERAAIQRR